MGALWHCNVVVSCINTHTQTLTNTHKSVASPLLFKNGPFTRTSKMSDPYSCNYRIKCPFHSKCKQERGQMTALRSTYWWQASKFWDRWRSETTEINASINLALSLTSLICKTNHHYYLPQSYFNTWFFMWASNCTFNFLPACSVFTFELNSQIFPLLTFISKHIIFMVPHFIRAQGVYKGLHRRVHFIIHTHTRTHMHTRMQTHTSTHACVHTHTPQTHVQTWLHTHVNPTHPTHVHTNPAFCWSVHPSPAGPQKNPCTKQVIG